MSDEVAFLKKDITDLERELERHRHGETLEGDFICPDSLMMTQLASTLEKTMMCLEGILSDPDLDALAIRNKIDGILMAIDAATTIDP
jgi:hypothetical protein